MGEVTVRDLRNQSAAMLARVSTGETLTITKDGEPVATVGPLPRRALGAKQLVARWRSLPRVDADQLRADLDALIDQSL